MEPLHKYPRTPHLEGSGRQIDDDPATVPWAALHGKHLVVEEKLDGANCGISFDARGTLLLQSRGHYLTGGPRERQFALLKSWTQRFATDLWQLLSDRYVLYGEWLYARHTIFYTDLPHLFIAYDCYDRHADHFLSTPRRDALLAHAPYLVGAPILATGTITGHAALISLIGPSHYVNGNHRTVLQQLALANGIDVARALAESDASGLMEGLYIKVEDAALVRERYKYVRPDYVQTVIDSGSHWMERPLLPNRLAPGVTLW